MTEKTATKTSITLSCIVFTLVVSIFLVPRLHAEETPGQVHAGTLMTQDR